jgi:Uma2 family endonuclease
MMTNVTVMTRETPWTVEELDNLPDDGLRYELFDGTLVVSAAPTVPHQRASFACARLLHAHCPSELEVFVAPLDYQPTRRSSVQPDVLVARRNALGIKNLTVAPVLVVEVLSDGTRSKDQIFKRELYQRNGVASYWVIDPDRATLTAYDRIDGTYRRAAQVIGTDTATLDLPFAVTVCPADLIAGR